MKKSSLKFLGLASLAFLSASAVSWASTATTPTPRNGPWLKRHEEFVATAQQGGWDVIFIGDSITDYWRSADKAKGGKAVWEQYFVPMHAANFGLASDRTQHVLWRVQHGELDGPPPKAIVLLIGTNNTGLENDKQTPRNTPEETADGIAAIVGAIRTKLPHTGILLLATFPRGEKTDPQRAQVDAVNARTARLDDGHWVRFLDIGAKFLTSDGTLPREIMPDLLHPNEKGYVIWAEAIRGPLQELMRQVAEPEKTK